ncbi:MAG: hypothetical protein EA368_13315 [Leptolyngbya sp. DLM2.Bin27]|nr:MAG: hypothetical protein EA368_13315 [Leptolyngbya sp. DLM2.Bin27]
MPQLTQGLIIASLIGLLLAVIVGYYLRQGQVNELTEALHQSQKRQTDLEVEHEQRLRDATLQLQADYEAQLAASTERYQAQLEDQRNDLEAEYSARQSREGDAAAADSSVELRIRKQYETRLKEVAAKMQQAYEQHLQARLAEVRSQVQQDYDQRLAEATASAIAAQSGFDQTQGQRSPSNISPGLLGPADQSIASLAAAASLADLETRLQIEYDQRLAERIAQYQDDMAQRLATMEQEYEARLQMVSGKSPSPSVGASDQPSTAELELNLRRELEAALRLDYEQKLAEKIEHYQDELTQRTQELEQSYEARLQLLQTGTAAAAPPSADFDLANAISLANETTPDTGFDLDVDDFSPVSDTPAATDDLDLAGLLDNNQLDSDTEGDPNAGFSLDAEIGTTDFARDDFARGDFASANFDTAEFATANFDTTDFDTEDLESLLNDPGTESASDDLLDSIDDISDLS